MNLSEFEGTKKLYNNNNYHLKTKEKPASGRKFPFLTTEFHLMNIIVHELVIS
jgi:hypothetical protein